MIHSQVIARRYAKGLLLSVEDGAFDQIESEFALLMDIVCSNSSDLTKLLFDKAFSSLEKKAALKRIAESSHMSDVLCKFLFLLIDKGRIALLPAIWKSLVDLLDDYKGRVRIKIKSAYPLDDEGIDAIKDALNISKAHKVMVDRTIDKELLGGIRVEMADTVFDGSIKAKLFSIKQGLLQGSF